MEELSTSESFKLNKVDLIKIAKFLLYVTLGAILTGVSQVYLNIDWSIHFGGNVYDFSPIITVLISTAIRALKSFVTNYGLRNGFGTGKKPE